MQTKYRQHLGKHRVVWFWLLGLLVAWWATNAKQVSTAFGENVWLLGLFAAGATHPFCFTLLPLVGVLVGSACLACCLLGFGENTYRDAWIMDREIVFCLLVCWYACRDCLRDTVLDGYAMFSECVLV